MTGYSTFADAMASSRGAGAVAQPRRGRSPKLGGGNGTVKSSVVNLLNTILGAGTLAMPLAMSRFGVTFGVLVLAWCGLTSAFGLYLQSRCARYTERGTCSFFALSQLTFPNWGVAFDIAIAIKCFGVGVSYMVIIGELMPAVARAVGLTGYAFFDDRRFWIACFFAFAIVPLSFPKTLDALKHASLVALVSIGYLIFLVIYHFFVDSRDQRGEVNYFTWGGGKGALKSLPVMIFAYTCHQNMFSIINELEDNSPSTIVNIIGSSIGSAFTVYVVVAITGYLTFGSNVQSNIVGMYPGSIGSTIGKAAIVVLVTLSVPLQVHPCRISLDAVLRFAEARWRRGGNNRSSTRGSSAPNANGSQPLLATSPPAQIDSHGAPVVAMSDYRFALLTSLILVAGFVVALTVSDLESVLGFVGATGSTMISFILPGIFYYFMSNPDSIHHQRLTKEDDDADYSDSASSNVADDPEAGVSGADGRSANTSGSWATGLVAKVRTRFTSTKGRTWKGDFRWDLDHFLPGGLRKWALALTIYGVCILVICLGSKMLPD